MAREYFETQKERQMKLKKNKCSFGIIDCFIFVRTRRNDGIFSMDGMV